MNKTLRNFALVALAAAPFSAFAEITGAGTAADPYQIATAEDLTNACQKVIAEGAADVIYFIQTADIDMADVKNYFAVNGTYGNYEHAIVYDGCNHVIANFSPDYVVDGGAQGYYNGSIFGVLSGKVMNLGVVDAKVDMKGADKTAGILGAYFGHGSVKSEDYKTSSIENVYVTGEIACGNYNTGGMFGTTGSDVNIINCFANVKYTGTGGKMGGMIGRVNHATYMENCYVAGTVNEGAGLICGEGSATLTVNGFVVFNTGSTKVSGVTVEGDVTMANTSATKSSGVEEVKGWDAYSETEEIDGYPALAYRLSGEGTKDNPYIIASAMDLANAYRFVDCVKGGDFYFVQTADIDMEGVDEYSAVAGYNGAYKAILHYDGQNHLIKNFAPADTPLGNADNTRFYYCTSIFGVPSGEIKNLGVVDAYCATAQGAGILGAYAGQSAGSTLRLDNVFVEGEVMGEGGYTGGMFGTTGMGLTLVNCFANVTVSGKAYTAGLVGRMRNDIVAENVYVAGTVAGDNLALVCSTDKTPSFTGVNVVAFNTGADAALAADIKSVGEDVIVATEATKAELIAEVTEWSGYTDKLYKGYPMLDGFDVEGSAGIFDAIVDEAESNGPAVYYNLQGVRVANPDNGIYIVRRGSKVTKELVK